MGFFGNAIKWVLVAIVLIALVSFSVTYTVRFTEAAVLTTFGAADETSVKREPGLKFKLPFPIQSVTKYDTRTRVLNLRMEALQTADRRIVIVEAFCIWRVSDPLKFFQRFSNAGERAELHYREAEKAISANLRAASGIVSRYQMTELFGTGGASKLPELEAEFLRTVRESADKTGLSLSDYGIQAEIVGVSRIVLPEEVTKAVFDRMKAAREKITAETESIGRSQADAIRATAEADARKINQFAERLAQEIRNKGDLEAAPFLAQMNTNAELQVFLENMRFLREAFSSKGATLVLPSDMPGVGLLSPDSLSGLGVGQVPSIGGGEGLIRGLAVPSAGGSDAGKERAQ